MVTGKYNEDSCIKFKFQTTGNKPSASVHLQRSGEKGCLSGKQSQPIVSSALNLFCTVNNSACLTCCTLLYNLRELLIIDVCSESVHDSLFPVTVVEKTRLINVIKKVEQLKA